MLAVRRAGACPRRPRGFTIAHPWLRRTKAFPLGGRWQPEGLTDEGQHRKHYRQRQSPKEYGQWGGNAPKTLPRGEGGPAQAGSDAERRNVPKRMHPTKEHPTWRSLWERWRKSLISSERGSVPVLRRRPEKPSPSRLTPCHLSQRERQGRRSAVFGDVTSFRD